MSRRIGIVGLLHESNTFITAPTLRAHFEADLLLQGEAIREAMAQAPHEVGGFFEILDAAGVEVVPVFLARALPYGPIAQEVFATLVAEMLAGLAAAGPLDGILAAPHGATVAEACPDADGHWLARVREFLGPDRPLIATIDPHANVSPQMVAATDALVAYRTNPHLDQRDTGRRAARLMLGTLEGRIRPAQALAALSLAINIRVQNTSDSPLREWIENAERLAADPGLLDWSLILGFPYADVPEMGSGIVVVTDGNEDRARELAEKLAASLWDHRGSFDPPSISAAEAFEIARSRDGRPAVLLDMGDNVGGGSPANRTDLVHAWQGGGGQGSLFICLHDPAAADLVRQAGIGSQIEARLGDPDRPVSGRFEVVSIHDGIFTESEARHGGFVRFDQGPTAILRAEDSGLVIMVTTRRMAPFSLAQLTSCGIDPLAFDFIVAKGVIAPMAAYAPVARGGFIHVDTPGPTCASMTRLDYRHRRRPMFPFEKD